MNTDPRQAIVGLMVFSAAFALVGHTAKSTSNPNAKQSNVSDSRILLGMGIGTVLLIGISEAGPGPASFAKGLAVVTLISSILFNGTEVFGVISKITGTKTTPTQKTTSKTGKR